MPKEHPLVGFDRFIRWEWAEQALELAYQGRPLSELKAYLDAEIAGKDSARKTFNLLTNLWFEDYQGAGGLRQQAFEHYPDLTERQRLVLHWGMALNIFPFFYQTTTIMGRLLRLQGGFQGKEIVTRTNELYSNLSTIPRATARTIQTLAGWGVLNGTSTPTPTYTPAAPLELTSAELVHWLLEAVLRTPPVHTWRVIDLLRAPALFPFALGEQGTKAVYAGKGFVLARDSFGDEVVGMEEG